MRYKYLGLIISITLSVIVWVLHKDRWFVPDPNLKNTFWPQHGFGAIFTGTFMGILLFLLTLLIHNYLVEKKFSNQKTSLISIILLSTSIISWGFLWEYIENSEIRRNKNTIQDFRNSYYNFTDFKSIEGDTSDSEKNLIYNFYNSLWNISADHKKSNPNEILNFSTQQFGLYMYDL